MEREKFLNKFIRNIIKKLCKRNFIEVPVNKVEFKYSDDFLRRRKFKEEIKRNMKNRGVPIEIIEMKIEIVKEESIEL